MINNSKSHVSLLSLEAQFLEFLAETIQEEIESSNHDLNDELLEFWRQRSELFRQGSSMASNGAKTEAKAIVMRQMAELN